MNTAPDTAPHPVKQFTISLQNRLALTYALFTGLALTGLTLTMNIFTGLVFTNLVKTNIAEKSSEIVKAIAGQYNPLSRSFDAVTVEAMGMYFVHEGYIVTVEDEAGGLVWNARACDMQECMMVISDIAGRMEGSFGIAGALRKEAYPVPFAGRTVGTVTIETYGPFFYSETEGAFLTSINRLLLLATLILTLASLVISVILSRAIARPVNRSAEAARRIAQVHGTGGARSGGAQEKPKIRIDGRWHTRELAELARSINSLAAGLEEGERRQKQLTSDIAHELRTPLTCLQGDIEAMIDGVYQPDMEHLESLHGETLRLARLVQDLNTLTGLEWDTITLNKTGFDAAALLRTTAEQFRAAAREKGIEIKLDLIESPISADYDRLKQVFINLLSNAVKYTDEGGVTISIEESREGGGSPPHGARPNFVGAPTSLGTVAPPPPQRGTPSPATPPLTRLITIADTGIGIPEGDLPHIFERFYRADKSRSRSTGGAGIGLTIAAAIVHAHGGTITAESGGASAGGSVFRVRL